MIAPTPDQLQNQATVDRDPAAVDATTQRISRPTTGGYFPPSRY
jgi:hypothetical protein